MCLERSIHPEEAASAAPGITASPSRAARATSARGVVVKQLLLVHDSDVVMNALGLVLEQEGYDVQVVRTLVGMRGFAPDLVLADALEPSVNGQGAVADLKLSMSIGAPIYLFSSGEQTGLQMLAERAGADGYVCTEWGFKRLLSVVRRLVSESKRQTYRSSAEEAQVATSNRVLIIDDHEGARRRLREALTAHGYAVQACADLPEVEQLMVRWEPDVVLADVVLKGVPGDQICRQLKARMSGRLVPIILVSSLPEAELQARAERAGADAYFRKQDGLPKLLEALQALLSEIVF